MKEGFTFKNVVILKNDNCILVDNYILLNVISNIPVECNYLNIIKDKNSIGVWKIKSLKN